MILPPHRKKRRVQIPDGLVVEYKELITEHRQQVGPFLVTSKERTLADCTLAGIAIEPLQQATSHTPQDQAPPTPSRRKTPGEEFAEDLNKILAGLGVQYRAPLPPKYDEPPDNK